MTDKDNVYCYTDKRLLYLNDDVDNATIGKLIASMLYIISEDDAKDEKEKNFTREPIMINIRVYVIKRMRIKNSGMKVKYEINKKSVTAMRIP